MTDFRQSWRGRGTRERVALLLLVSALAVGVPQAGAEQPRCDGDRMAAAVEPYMKAMIHGQNEPSLWDAVPLAPNVRRVEHPPGTYNGTPARGGPVTGKTADQIRGWSLTLPTLRVTTGLREYDDPARQYVDERRCEIAVFWIIDLGTRRPDGGADNFGTAHVAERFRIKPDDYTITQIDAIFYHGMNPDAQSCWPANGTEGTTGPCTTPPPVPWPKQHCAPSSFQRIEAAVTSYVDALRTHDADHVRLADDARRTEMPPPAGSGPVTGSDAAAIRASLENDSRFTSITDVRDVRWLIDRKGCEVVAFYLVDTPEASTSEPAAADGVPYTVHVATRFRVSQGRIQQIESIAYPHQNEQPEGSCWTGFDNEKVQPGSREDTEDYAYFSIPCPAGY